MLTVNKEDTAVFSISFGGENEIEVEALLGALDGTLELLNYIVQESNPDAYLKLKVESTPPGSFKVNFSTLVGFVSTLMSNGALTSGLELAKTSIDTMMSLFSLKKHLDGEKPKEVIKSNGSVTITNHNGKEMSVTNNIYNFYGHPTDRAMARVIRSIPGDRTQFVISKQDGTGIMIPNTEFENMEREIATDKEPKETFQVYNAKASFRIKKPDFSGESQWELIKLDNNKTIRAKIEDKDFLLKVHNGDVAFSSNTYISVSLETTVFFDEINQPTGIVKHIIKEVYDISDDIDVIAEQLKFDN